MSAEPRRKLRLINPRSPLSTISMPGIIQRMTFSRKALFMPLNLAICAAVVPEGWDVEIVDENAGDEPHVPAAAGIDAVGIGAMTTQATRAYELADAYRKLGVKVILGGIHPSALPEEAGRHADIVCRGDAEGTLPRALKDLDAGATKAFYDWTEQPEAPIASPRKDLLNPRDYLVFNPIQTTRGCPHDCTFCTTPAIFGRRYRRRPIEDIVEEIRAAREQFGTELFIFSDDNVAGSPKWAMDLFDALRELDIRWASQCDILIARDRKLLEAMRDSGCSGLILGLESPRAGTLQEAGKRFVSAEMYKRYIRTIQSYGIGLWGSFIFGFDSDDWRDCMDSVRFAQKMKLSMGLFIILTPYPGTAVFEQFRREGRILTEDWTKYNGATVCYQPRKMSVEQLRHAQLAAMYEFYSPASALRRLGVLPFKKHSWLANMAAHHGMRYYYARKGRTLPHFRDMAAVDSEERIARSLGIPHGVG
jgi:radical SAM superfamily enzyme YgiQ (UPF0313 family)